MVDVGHADGVGNGLFIPVHAFLEPSLPQLASFSDELAAVAFILTTFGAFDAFDVAEWNLNLFPDEPQKRRLRGQLTLLLVEDHDVPAPDVDPSIQQQRAADQREGLLEEDVLPGAS